jgi:hypothetical protein
MFTNAIEYHIELSLSLVAPHCGGWAALELVLSR